MALLAAGAMAQSHGASTVKGSVKVDGSSTVGPISMIAAEEFKKVAPGVEVAVGISGTGGGFKKFTVGETDVSDASRPITPDEQQKAKANGIDFIELPIGFDGISIVTNTKNTWCTGLTLDEVKRIFSEGSKVKSWKDIRPEWPATPIKLYAPGTDSGTFDYFKEVVVGKGAVRADMSVSEDDNVLVRGVEGDEGAIGFFGFAYYVQNKDKLHLLSIDAGKGAVSPSHETIQNGTYAPFSRPLFIYVNAKSASRPAVKAFVSYYVENAARLAEKAMYVKLPAVMYERGATNWQERKTGTQMTDEKGEKRPGPIDQVYH